jgi:uncharacterized protein DUF6894
MPLYFFNLRDATGLILDPDGTYFSDESSAREHARIVARELMHNPELDWRAWQLEVCDAERRPFFHQPFVEVDPLPAQLPPGSTVPSPVDKSALDRQNSGIVGQLGKDLPETGTPDGCIC